MGYNSRLDTIQAVVGNWLIPKTQEIAKARIKNAKHFDEGLKHISGIKIPPRPENFTIVYHLYMVFASKRNALLKFLIENGIEAKVHYPTPIYLQPALKSLGYRLGDFPVTDKHADNLISFPCDQHLTVNEIDFVIDKVGEFYS